jgi:hypothetical protein
MSKYGPDEFDFHLEGPELIALDVLVEEGDTTTINSNSALGRRYVGKCCSEMKFSIKIPGKYHVNMVSHCFHTLKTNIAC